MHDVVPRQLQCLQHSKSKFLLSCSRTIFRALSGGCRSILVPEMPSGKLFWRAHTPPEYYKKPPILGQGLKFLEDLGPARVSGRFLSHLKLLIARVKKPIRRARVSIRMIRNHISASQFLV